MCEDGRLEHFYEFCAVAYTARGDMNTLELDVFWGKTYVVTHQGRTLDAVERVWAACQRDERHLASGTGYLMYRLADELVSDYMPAVEGIDETIDGIEDQVFLAPPATLPERIFTLKRSLLHLRRIIAPQREVLKLARGDFAVVRPTTACTHYDHLVRMYDIPKPAHWWGVLENACRCQQPYERGHEDADPDHHAVHAAVVFSRVLRDELLRTGHPARRLDR